MLYAIGYDQDSTYCGDPQRYQVSLAHAKLLKQSAREDIRTHFTDIRSQASEVYLLKHCRQIRQQHVVEEYEHLNASHEQNVPTEVFLLEPRHWVIF